MNWIGNFFFCVGTLTMTGSIALVLVFCLQRLMEKLSVGLRVWLFKLVTVLYLIPIVYPIIRISRYRSIHGKWVYEGIFGLGSSGEVERTFQLIGLIWLIGLIFGVLLRLMQYFKLKRILKHNVSISTGSWKTILEQEDWQNRLDKVNVYQNDSVFGPMVTGIFKPVIILPPVGYSELQQRMVMDHELMHITRRDLLWKRIILVVTWLHWFNPFVYLLFKRMVMEQEIECDIAICQAENGYSAKEYAQFLLTLGGGIQDRIFEAALFEKKSMVEKN